MKGSRAMSAICSAALALALGACTTAPVERGGGSRTTLVSVGFVDRTAEAEGDAGPAFLSSLARESGGSFEVRPVPRPGVAGVDVFEAVGRGELQAAWIRTDALESAAVGHLAALQAPFVVTTPDAQSAVTDPAVSGDLLATLDSAGVTALALWGGPLRRPIASEHALLDPDSWRGRRVRALSPTQASTFTAFGATPIEVSGDLNQLVPVGTVDAAETDLAHQLVAADYTIAPYITKDVVLWSRFSVLVVNKQWLHGLDDEQRAWITTAAEEGRTTSVDHGEGVGQEQLAVLRLCEAGARLPSAGSAASASLRLAVSPVLEALRADGTNGPLLAGIEQAVLGRTAHDALDIPGWCAGEVSPLGTVGRIPATRAPIPAGTYRAHLTSDDIAAAGVGKVQDAQVVTLVIDADGGYTNTSRFDDDGSVMVFEAGEVRGDSSTVYFINDLERLRALRASGENACVWTDPSLGCITNVAPYSVSWRLLDDGSLELSDPVGVTPDPVIVLTIVANPYRRVG